jgi:hypothetical protein
MVASYLIFAINNVGILMRTVGIAAKFNNRHRKRLGYQAPIIYYREKRLKCCSWSQNSGWAIVDQMRCIIH